MTITNDDYVQWKNSEITKTLFAAFYDRIDRMRYELGDTAGSDPLQDRFRVGYIKGLEEILYTSFNEASGELE